MSQAPIAPRPSEDPRQISQPSSSIERQRKASSACLACKQRKTKCAGGNPCEACSIRQTQCVYNLAADQRRKVANQRNVEELSRREEELQQYRLLLGGFMAIVRSQDSEMINSLLHAIRDKTDQEELTHYLENILTLRPNIDQAYRQISFNLGWNSSPPASVSPSLRTATIEREEQSTQDYLVNTPIGVQAPPWTDVANSEIVSHLLSLFFTWEQPFLPFVEKTSFLVDFHSGNILSSFCSRCLVHAILAKACLISQRNECKALQSRFFGEAKLHRSLESGKPSIATLQALLIMYDFESSRGRDRIGRKYRHEAVDMYRRLGFGREQRRPSGISDDGWRAVTTAVWGTFALDALTSYLYGFPPSIKPPSIERYFVEFERTDLDDRDSFWTPYPVSRSQRPACLTLTFHALCDLAEIYDEINRLNEINQGPSAPHEALETRIDIFRKLAVWQRRLDPRLRLDSEASLPHIYYLNVFYQIAHIILFRPLQEKVNLALPNDIGTPSEQIFTWASASMDTLWRFRSVYSFDHSSGIGLLGPIVISYTLIAHIKTTPQTHPLFTRACQAIQEHRRNLPIVPFLLAGLVLLGRQYDVTFNEEDEEYFTDLDFHPEVLGNVPMDFPTLLDIGDNISERGDLQVDSMGDLLAQWTSLSP